MKAIFGYLLFGLGRAVAPVMASKILGKPINNLVESVVDNVIREKVGIPAIGSVVYCDLAAGQAEHSGIYVGDNSIVHLNGDGNIEKVSPTEFMQRLGGLNTAISIYMSCNDGIAVGSPEVATRAISMIGKSRGYQFIMDNCHQFTAGCLTGEFENPTNFFVFLKHDVRKILGGTEWRVWY
jgi:hypothetical protein